MTWTGGYGAADLVASDRAAGRRVVALDRSGATTRIVEPVPWGKRPLTGLLATAAMAATTSGRPVPGDLLAEIDAIVGVPGVGRLLEPRVAAFLHRIVPRVDTVAGLLEPDLRRLGVDVVVTANPSTIEEFGALLAAGRIGIERRLAQHGDHMFSYDGWFVSELWNVDTVLASDATLLHDLPEAAERLGAVPPVVRESAHRHHVGRSGDAAGPVCYVPGVLMGDTSLRPSLYFDDAWYHRWHLRLLDFMRSRPDVRFLWKALPSGDHVADPIVEAIASVPNVDYVTQPLPWLLGDVSKVVTDFPSTPVYEARRAGVPSLVLWFPRFAELRPRARAEFGDAVVECKDEDHALADLGSWLSR